MNRKSSNFVTAKKNTAFCSMNNKDKTVLYNLNIIHGHENKADESPVCPNNSPSRICQPKILLQSQEFSTNTDEKLTTFRSKHQNITSAKDQQNIINISKLRNTSFLKDTSLSFNNIVLY